MPAKIFAIQTHSALEESVAFDNQKGLMNLSVRKIPVMILKSERDGVARYVPRIYDNQPNIEVIDVTNHNEYDLFREHLYHMVDPKGTTKLVDRFITETEAKRVRTAN